MNAMNARQPRVIIGFSALALAASLLVSCGGGSDSSGGDSGAVTTGILSGTATKGPVGSATVKAFAINDGALRRLVMLY